MKDIIGRKIVKGDYIAYSTTSSDSLSIGKIVSFTTIKPYHRLNSGANVVTVSTWLNVTGHARIHMQGKVFVIDKSQLPSKMKAVLDEAYELKVADKRSVPRRSVRAGRA